MEAPSGISTEYCQPDTHSRRTVIRSGPLVMPSHSRLQIAFRVWRGKRMFKGSCEALSEFKKSFAPENSAKLKGTGPPRSSPSGRFVSAAPPQRLPHSVSSPSSSQDSPIWETTDQGSGSPLPSRPQPPSAWSLSCSYPSWPHTDFIFPLSNCLQSHRAANCCGD